MSFGEPTHWGVLAGVAMCGVIAALCLRRTKTKSRQFALILIALISALSIAVFWFGYDGSSAPSVLTRLGLFGIKLKAILAATGWVALHRVQEVRLEPVFYGLLSFSAISGILFAMGVGVT